MENNIDKDIERINKLWYLLDDVYSTGLVEDEERNEYQQAISNVLSEFQGLREFSAETVKRNAELQEELETYKKRIDELENKVHYKICESCNKEYRTKRSDTKYCKECFKKVNYSNWYNSLTEEKKQERREKSKLAMRKYRERKKVEKDV